MARYMLAAVLLLTLTVIVTDAWFICKSSKHCGWGSWGSWGHCQPYNGKCGNGIASRVRHLKKIKSCFGRLTCSGTQRSTRSCTKCCPLDCLWGSWGVWSTCSRSCGGGTQLRHRKYSRHASCGGKGCSGSSSDRRSCNTHCCRQDCVWSNWCHWSGCTKTCGGGQQARSRYVTKSASCGGTCSGEPFSIQSCGTKICPTVDKTICETHKLTISCGTKKIHVTSASYGRSNKTTCPHEKIKTTSCHATKSLQRVRITCEGKTTCTLHASNSVFGDPCVNTYKYLKVKYQCQ